MTTASPDKNVANSPRSRCSTVLQGNPTISRDNHGVRAGDHLQNETRHDDQSQAITRVTEDASTQSPHVFSRFEPALPGASYTNGGHDEPGSDDRSQGNAHESLDSGMIAVADIGLGPRKTIGISRNFRHSHQPRRPANVGRPEVLKLASDILEAEDTSAEHLESIARQAWDSWHMAGSERDQTSRESVPQRQESSTSPLTELSLTSTEESASAGSSDSSQNASIRPKGPSALRPLNFGQYQRDSRKSLQNFEGEFSRTARKSCMSPSPARDKTSHESSSRWRPANRGAVGSDWTRSSSVREPQ